MKINLEELQKPKTIELNGNEEWLAELYKSFIRCKKEEPKLTGTLKISLEGYGYAKVEGDLSYLPKVPCSRCADPITWPINKSFVAKFKPKDEMADASDVELIADDLEYYYIENNSLDIQQVIIDTVVTTLPSQLVIKSEDGKSCQICGIDLNNDEVYRTRSKEEDSPFAVLKNMKLPN